MPPNPFEELAARWVPGEGPVRVLPLTNGLVNQSCRVWRAGREYSLRITAVEGLEFGLDRRWECAVRERTGTAGLAPTVVCCQPRRGLLIAEWAMGGTWEAEETREPGNIDAMARLLRRVHALEIPQPARCMHPGDWIARYRTALVAHARAAPGPSSGPDAEPLREAVLSNASEAYLARLAQDPKSGAVLCHSDLHRQNLLIGDRTLLLDWEFAHVSQGLWDLGGWAANNDWTEAEAARLLSGYLQRPPRTAEFERLATWTWLYDYVCLLWSELYLVRRPGAASTEIRARAKVLAARLARSAQSGGRAPRIPAH
jgi:thiamine kinase-like enzyme